MTAMTETAAPADDAVVTGEHDRSAGRRRRALRRNVALGGLVGGAAVFTSGCSLSDVSTILSILRLLGIIA